MNITPNPRAALVAAGVCALAAASGAAQAQAYAAAGLGLARQELTCAAGAPCKRSAAGGKALLGYRIDPSWTVEGVVLGALSQFKASDGNDAATWHGRVSVRALGATAGFEFGQPDWRLQLRAGLAQVRARFTSGSAGVADSSATTSQPLLGLGLRHEVAAGTTLRLDWDATRAKAYHRQGSFKLFGVHVEQRF